MTTAAANAEQVRYWNEIAGPKWVALHDFIEPQVAPIGTLAMDRAGIADGERVLDVGCGCGETTIELGRRVGPQGEAKGVDISAVMLERGRAAARAQGRTNVVFEEGDAQTYAFAPASFDLVFSRFGVMFFANPVAAFANLRSALRPGGRVVFVCWQGLQENEWMLVPLGAVIRHIQLPPPAPPGAPGPFAFADGDRLRRTLTDAGFAGVELQDLRGRLSVGGGGDLNRTVEFLMQMGPAAAALREADPSLRVPVAESMRTDLLPYLTEEGLGLGFAAWIVGAKNR